MIKVLIISLSLGLSVFTYAKDGLDLSFLGEEERKKVKVLLDQSSDIKDLKKGIKNHSQFTISKFNEILIKENKEMTKKNLLLIQWPREEMLIKKYGDIILRDLR